MGTLDLRSDGNIAVLKRGDFADLGGIVHPEAQSATT